MLRFNLLSKLPDTSLLVNPSRKDSPPEIGGHSRVVVGVSGAILEFPSSNIGSFPGHEMTYHLTIHLSDKRHTVTLFQEHRCNGAHEVLDVLGVGLGINMLEPAETIVRLEVSFANSLTVV